MFLIWCNRMHVEKIYDFVYYLFLFVICVGHALFIYTPELQLFRLFFIFLPIFLFYTNYQVSKINITWGILVFFNVYLLYNFWITILFNSISFNNVFNFIILTLFANFFLFMSAKDIEKRIKNFYIFSIIFLIGTFIWTLFEIYLQLHLPISRFSVLEEKSHIPTVFYHNENDFAAVYLLIFLLRSCIKVELYEKKVDVFDLLFFIMSLVISMVTQARLVFLILFISILLLFFFRFGFAIKSLILSICSFFCVFNFDILLDFFKLFFSNKGSNEIRFNLILTGLESFTRYGNILGYGINQSDYYYEKILHTDRYLGGIINPHAFLVEILLNSGLIFFLGFLICNFYLTFYFYRKKKYLFSIYSLLYFFILMGSSSSLFLWPHYLCFFMLFIVKKSMEKSINYKNVREP